MEVGKNIKWVVFNNLEAQNIERGARSEAKDDRFKTGAFSSACHQDDKERKNFADASK